MNYPITALTKDPRTGLLSYVIRATVPTALWSRLADAAAVPLYAGMNAADLADLRAGKIVERAATLDMTLLDVDAAAAEAVKAQAAFQADVDAGSLDRWGFFGVQYNGSVWGS
jgi:hypothetical protein